MFGALPAHVGVVACSATVPYLPAEQQFGGHRRHVEVLFVGVAHHKIDIRDVLAVHIIDSVSAAASHTDHFL